MLNYNILENDSMVINFEGKTFIISIDDTRYNPILKAIQDDNLDDIPNLIDNSKFFEDQNLKLIDGLVYFEDNPLPNELSQKILQFKEHNLPMDRLVKFWENLKDNPSFNSRKMLFNFLENNGHPLTDDGHFIAYRGVTSDFKDNRTNTFCNKPGSICEMPRDQVDDNPENTCSNGLHVACHDYADGFGAKLIEVKVNPKDVVCVPKDYNGTKMRVSRFEVIKECEQKSRQLAYGIDHEENDDDICPALREVNEQYGLSSEEEVTDDEVDFICENCNGEIDRFFESYCKHCGEEL